MFGRRNDGTPKIKKDPKAAVWLAVAAVMVAVASMVGFNQEGAGAHGGDSHGDTHEVDSHDDHGDSHDDSH